MTDPDGAVRPCDAEVQRWINDVGTQGLAVRLKEAETIFRRIGITFAVYGEGGDPGRLIPFDLLPRISPQRSGVCSIAASASARQRSTPSSMTSITAAR